MKKYKIESCIIPNGKTIYTIYFKPHSGEQEEVEKYLDSIKAREIGTTYLNTNKAYIDYYLEVINEKDYNNASDPILNDRNSRS